MNELHAEYQVSRYAIESFSQSMGEEDSVDEGRKETRSFVRRNNNYGVCCSDVMPVSEKNIDRELRRPDGDDTGVTLFM